MGSEGLAPGNVGSGEESETADRRLQTADFKGGRKDAGEQPTDAWGVVVGGDDEEGASRRDHRP